MVGRRLVAARVVEVNISGPKALIKEAVIAQVSEAQTWLEVLNGTLNLQEWDTSSVILKQILFALRFDQHGDPRRDAPDIPEDRGVFVCSMRYCPSNPKDNQGWRCELTETVGHFIGHYERKRPPYRVRLCHPYDISNYSVNVASKRNVNSKTSGAATQSQSVSNGVRRPNITISTQGSTGHCRNINEVSLPLRKRQYSQVNKLEPDIRENLRNLRSIKVEIAEEPALGEFEEEMEEEEEEIEIPASRQRLEPDLVEDENNDDDYYFDDADSLCTALTEQEAEFVRDGIQVKDVKSTAMQKLSKIDNTVLLRIGKEIATLKNNNKWQRNVARSPLTCWFVQELLAE